MAKHMDIFVIKFFCDLAHLKFYIFYEKLRALSDHSEENIMKKRTFLKSLLASSLILGGLSISINTSATLFGKSDDEKIKIGFLFK